MTLNRPQAKISDNRLVLSLPDAMTPVVWMMDLADEGTFILRVQQNDGGLYILQKLSRDGKKIEDIAYYAREAQAKKAMAIMTNSLAGASKSVLGTGWKMAKTLLFIAGILAILNIIVALNDHRIVPLFQGDQATAPVTSSSPQTPVVTDDRNAVGVPMSADDFLRSPENLLPF